MGTNRYAYSANDPVNALDPGGNFWGPVVRWLGSQVARSWSSSAAVATTAGSASTGQVAPVGTSATLGQAMIGAATAGAISTGVNGLGSTLTGPLPDSADFTAGLTQGKLVAGEKYVWANDALAATSADPGRGQGLLDRYLGTAFTGLGTHGNSLQSPNPNELYHLRERLPGGALGEITKIGITSDLQGGRYTQPQLNAMNSAYLPQGTFPNRLAARTAEVQHTLNFVIQNGRFPKYTFTW